jgi:hypothetical protein
MKKQAPYMIPMKPITTLARRFAAFVNAPPVASYGGSVPQLQDYPVSKPPVRRR